MANNPKGNPQNLTRAGMGRPKGAKNKFTSFKDSILQVYQDIGGDKAFAEWAAKRENQGEFYKLAAKMIPKEVEVAGTLEHTGSITHRTSTVPEVTSFLAEALGGQEGRTLEGVDSGRPLLPS